MIILGLLLLLFFLWIIVGSINTQVNEEGKKDLEKYDTLYKKKGIRTVTMKGMYYRRLKPKKHVGTFTGYAKPIRNRHDTFGVGIFNDDDEHLGFAPYGNYRLHNSIQEWDSGKSLAFGKLWFNDYDERWGGEANILVGIDKLKAEQLIGGIQKRQKVNSQLTDRSLAITEALKLVESLIELTADTSDESNDFVKVDIQASFIPRLAKKFEEAEMWRGIILLSELEEIKPSLPERNKSAFQKRVIKAQKNLNA